MRITQEPLFPTLVPPRVIQLYPSLVTRCKRHQTKDVRLEAHRLSYVADKLSSRAVSWTGEGSMFENPSFFYLWMTFWNGVEAMAGTGKKAGTDRYAKPDWQGFVERRLTDEELVELDNWHPEAAEIWETVSALTQEGYDFKLSYSPILHAATATMVDGRPKLRTTGYALSARDANGALALKALLFKHMLILESDWVPLLDSPKPAVRG